MSIQSESVAISTMGNSASVMKSLYCQMWKAFPVFRQQTGENTAPDRSVDVVSAREQKSKRPPQRLAHPSNIMASVDSEDDIEMASPNKLLKLPEDEFYSNSRDLDHEKKKLRKLRTEFRGEDSPSLLKRSLNQWGRIRQGKIKEDLGPEDSISSSHYVEICEKSENSQTSYPKSSPRVQSVTVYGSDGVQTPVKSYREGKYGIRIGFTDDGRILIAKPTSSQPNSRAMSVCSSMNIEARIFDFLRSN